MLIGLSCGSREIFLLCHVTSCDIMRANFIEITLRHKCSAVNLLHIFRTLFLKKTSGWLLLSTLLTNLVCLTCMLRQMLIWFQHIMAINFILSHYYAIQRSHPLMTLTIRSWTVKELERWILRGLEKAYCKAWNERQNLNEVSAFWLVMGRLNE